MTNDDSRKQPSGGAMWISNLKRSGINHGTPMWLTLLSTVALVILIWLMAHFGERMEHIEDLLEYQPPVTKSTQLNLSQLPALNPRSIQVVDGQKVYVPAYSHIYGEGGKPFLLETTLSIRNTDPEHAIDITSARYYDTKGKLIEEYIDSQLQLEPLETAAFLVEKTNTL